MNGLFLVILDFVDAKTWWGYWAVMLALANAAILGSWLLYVEPGPAPGSDVWLMWTCIGLIAVLQTICAPWKLESRIETERRDA